MRFHSNASSLSSFIPIGWFFVMMVGINLIAQHPIAVDAQALRNDLCLNAQPITIGSSPVPVKYNTTSATIDLDVPNDCLNGSPPSYPGIWFNFTGTGGRIVARGCELSFFNTFISVFTGGCDPSKLQCVASTLTGCERERFIFETTLGTAYYVLVQLSYETVDVDVSIFAAPPIGNDLCTGAQPFKLGSLLYTDPSLATTDEATVFNDCIDSGEPLYPGLWYNFTGTGEVFTASACDVAFTYITIFSGSCGRLTLQCVKASTNPCPFFTFETTKDTVYLAFVQSYYDTIADLTILASAPTTESPTSAPIEACGLFRLNIFCPLQFRGIFGRFIRRIFG